jgi:hypothetical protein
MITIGLSTHRVESLPFILEHMQRHRRIVLENEPSHDLDAMLREESSIEEYVSGLETEFPEFERRLANHLQELHRSGKRIVQVEPFLEKLARIHDLFEAGKTPDDVLGHAELREVYLAEKNATGALITYYARSRHARFEDVVESVKAFARADAHRLVLRDRLRARAIAALARPGDETYVEAGTIHQRLCHFLRRELDGRDEVRAVHLLAPLFERFGGKRDEMTPGDRLTLYYASMSKPNEALMTLLAARSLVHIKLIRKEELLPGDGSHVEDEVVANRLVERLEFHHCRELFDPIRDAPRARALESVQAYLLKERLGE